LTVPARPDKSCPGYAGAATTSEVLLTFAYLEPEALSWASPSGTRGPFVGLTILEPEALSWASPSGTRGPFVGLTLWNPRPFRGPHHQEPALQSTRESHQPVHGRFPWAGTWFFFSERWPSDRTHITTTMGTNELPSMGRGSWGAASGIRPRPAGASLQLEFRLSQQIGTILSEGEQAR